ncbi:apoptosis-inducing factor 1, mitochondrial isoform X1 [Diabrotica virgifera virgifera]|uniref:Apoptosis-inducing factor 1, mitochondrial isoform X1 n=2 Tax=Diabrotica virgifera virgifera TaxID=50390 RepID=A0A6P7FKZ1_DIAVI|nr:apoptosis-inducing factor 1, mitochondrial isoform X1 [Diabrotica virgifera virgifera]XP_050512546.1 apoptosis-inducing factor 1, mitochondrial isoform X1 [Diabrotica virgifera virgifera]
MLRIRQISKVLAVAPLKFTSMRHLAHSPFKGILTRASLCSSIRTYSSKNDDCKDDPKKNKKKVCEKTDESIQSHPSPAKPPEKDAKPTGLRLKECRAVDINPCKPTPTSKIPSIKDCKHPNLMSEIPDPKCDWKEKDKAARDRNKKLLIFGLLLTAFTIGVLFWLNPFHVEEVKQKVEKKEKKKRKLIKHPLHSKDIPKDVPYLLIGGGTASFTAFRAIKSADPTAKVLIISSEYFYPYMRPPLSKEIWFNDSKESVEKLNFKQWNGSERSLMYEPDDFYIDCKSLMSNPNGGVAVARGWSINKLDVFERIAYLEDGSEIRYNKCLVATGAKPKIPPVFEAAKEDDKLKDLIMTYRDILDFEECSEKFEHAQAVAIIGGGFLGSELACAMARKASKDTKDPRKIYQLFKEGGNMGKVLPEYLSLWTTEKVKDEGVRVKPHTEVIGVKHDGKKGMILTLNDNSTLHVDCAIVAMGVEPNTDLAEESDLEVDPELGGFLVNTELQARSDVYIAGDCACFYDTKLGRRRFEHHDHAVVTGRLAGENMTGGRKPYLHQSMFWSDLGPDVGYEAIGIVDSALPTVAVFAKATDKDNPRAVVTATDEGIRSKTEEVPEECNKYLTEEQKKELEEKRRSLNIPNVAEGEDFGKGIIFYLRDDIVVGIVLWNVFNRMNIARQVLMDQKKYEDLNEVAKLFNIHDESVSSESSEKAEDSEKSENSEHSKKPDNSKKPENSK